MEQKYPIYWSIERFVCQNGHRASDWHEGTAGYYRTTTKGKFFVNTIKDALDIYAQPKV